MNLIHEPRDGWLFPPLAGLLVLRLCHYNLNLNNNNNNNVHKHNKPADASN